VSERVEQGSVPTFVSKIANVMNRSSLLQENFSTFLVRFQLAESTVALDAD